MIQRTLPFLLALPCFLWTTPAVARGDGALSGGSLDLRRTAVVEAVERTGPSVVNISCEEVVR